MLAAWRTDYNIERPHSRLGWQTAAAFEQTFAPQPALRSPHGSAADPLSKPLKWAKLKPGVSLKLDET